MRACGVYVADGIDAKHWAAIFAAAPPGTRVSRVSEFDFGRAIHICFSNEAFVDVPESLRIPVLVATLHEADDGSVTAEVTWPLEAH